MSLGTLEKEAKTVIDIFYLSLQKKSTNIEKIWMEQVDTLLKDKSFKLDYLIIAENVPNQADYIYNSNKKNAVELKVGSKKIVATKFLQDKGIIIADIMPIHTKFVKNKEYMDFLEKSLIYITTKMKLISSKITNDTKICFAYKGVYDILKKLAKKKGVSISSLIGISEEFKTFKILKGNNTLSSRIEYLIKNEKLNK